MYMTSIDCIPLSPQGYIICTPLVHVHSESVIEKTLALTQVHNPSLVKGRSHLGMFERYIIIVFGSN